MVMVTKVVNWYADACDFCRETRPIVAIILYITIIVFSIYGMYLLHFWWSDDSPVVEFGKGVIVPEVVHRGETALVYIDVKKLRDCYGETERILTGACGYHVLLQRPSVLKKDFEGRLTLSIQIPHEVIPGMCFFKVYARYTCNPFDWIFQRQVFESPEIPFTVKDYAK